LKCTAMRTIITVNKRIEILNDNINPVCIGLRNL